MTERERKREKESERERERERETDRQTDTNRQIGNTGRLTKTRETKKHIKGQGPLDTKDRSGHCRKTQHMEPGGSFLNDP